ncbi:GTPase HflX, partial [Acinetobacter lactucae]|nr:GTPase HflX [Acinetobacter lactucae]
GLLHIDVKIAPHKLEKLIRQAKLPLDEILGEHASQFKRPWKSLKSRARSVKT